MTCVLIRSIMLVNLHADLPSCRPAVMMRIIGLIVVRIGLRRCDGLPCGSSGAR
jgi:hypothetical protein